MAADSKIEWTDHTFNPWIGCTKVSIEATGGGGCDHCYAEVSTPVRVLRGKGAETWGAKAPRVRTSAANWALPKRWNAQHQAFFAQHGRRQRVFCASLADVFDNAVDPHWRADLFNLIAATPNLDWLLLTKRIGNVDNMLPVPFDFERLYPNVWIGATVVNQVEADRDVPKLLSVPAAKRFLSMEPLLGPVAIWKYTERHCERHPGKLDHDGKCEVCEGRGIWGLGDDVLTESEKAPIRAGLDWVIVGGESGPSARPMDPAWAISLRDQCQDASVPFFFKQSGEWTYARPARSETPGRYALAPRTFDGPIVQIDHYPRQFTSFGSAILERVGKNAAGRLLAGREWNEVPQ
jgi:protein gp37